MIKVHFMPHQMKLAIQVAESERETVGIEYRIEYGAVIAFFEPEYRVERYLRLFHEANMTQ